MPCGPKKRRSAKKTRSAKKKTLVSPDNATDPQVEANAVIDPTSVEVEDSLAVKPSSSAAVKFTEPVGTVSLKEDVLVDNVNSEEVVELGSKENDGKNMHECVRDSTLKEVEGNEPAEEGIDSGPKENDGKPVVEVSLTNQLELASGAKENDGKELASGIVSDEDDSILFKEAIKNDFSDDISVNIHEPEKGKKLLIEAIDEVQGLRKSVNSEEVVELGSKENDGEDMPECVRDSTLKEVEGNEPAEEGIDPGPKENDGKPVVEVSLNDQLELASGAKENDGKPGIVPDKDDLVLFKEAIKNDFSDDISVKMDEPENGKKLLIVAIDEAEGLKKSMEAQLHVAEALVVRLQQMLAHLQQLLANWDLIETTPTTATI